MPWKTCSLKKKRTKTWVVKSQFAWMRINIFCGHAMPNLGKDLPKSSSRLILFSSGKRKAHAREVPEPNGSLREGWKEPSSDIAQIFRMFSSLT